MINDKYDIEYLKTEIPNYYYNESAYFYTFHNCALSIEIRSGKKYEPYLHDVFYKYINKDSIVLEGGANIGYHSILLSKISKKLICFEPLKETYNILEKNIHLNKCKNIDSYSLGLSDEISKAKFAIIPFGNPGGSCLDNNPVGLPYENSTTVEEQYDVNLICIDNLNLNKLDFIKLDIEGYEQKAIKGGIETIKRHKPIIVLECWSDHFGNYNIEDAKNKFRSLIEIGYTIENCGGPNWLFLPKK